jgi:hypothetical protein
MQRQNVLLKMNPFSEDEALQSTRKHAACTSGGHGVKKKKQIGINHIQEGIGHGGQRAGQVEGKQ